MIIDSHVHLKHGDLARTEYTAKEINEVMDAAGIDRSVVFAMSTTTRDSVRRATAAVAQFPDRLLPYVYALPNYERPALDELREAVTERGFRGIKVHAAECSLPPYVVDPVFALAGECGVPCLVDFCGDLQAAGRLARGFSDTRLIVAHLGLYHCTDWDVIEGFIGLAEECGNVWLDASGVVLAEAIALAASRLGASRVLFGTDGPQEQPDVVTYAQRCVDEVRGLDLPAADIDMILGGSVSALLGLDG